MFKNNPFIKAFTADERLNLLLLRITCLFWVLAKLIGWRMFTTYRLFPVVPVFELLNGAPSYIHTILFIVSILLAILLFGFGQKRYLLILAFVFEILLCLLDQNRWQPWEYQYLFIIFIFIVNNRNPRFIPIAIGFILAFTYIYSGLGKINHGFLQSIWSNTILIRFFKLPLWIVGEYWIYFTGYLLGLIEFAAGIGLLFSKTKKLSAIILILMHLFILCLMSPAGLNINKVVWPWNIAMILYLYLIFVKSNDVIFSFVPINMGWNKLLILCWAIMPAFSFIGLWDNYLSSKIYSGKLPKMTVCIKDTNYCKPILKFGYKDNAVKNCGCELKINIQHWALVEANVTVYPEPRVYKAIQEELNKRYPLAGLTFH